MTEAGVGGVSRVELWYTLDGGLTWLAKGTDEDRTSPFLVELDREGTFGFRLHIYDEYGQSAPPPQPGDQPDLSLVVDWVRPVGRIVSADAERDATRNRIVIQWEADDEHLAESPIVIQAAPAVSGPWSSITPGPIANTGEYIWSPSRALAARTYLRLIVQDRAGNETMALRDQPIGAGSQPRAVIRRIEPVEATPSIPARGPER